MNAKIFHWKCIPYISAIICLNAMADASGAMTDVIRLVSGAMTDVIRLASCAMTDVIRPASGASQM